LLIPYRYYRANDALFNFLDEFHQGVSAAQDETFSYRASDVVVATKMEVPVPLGVAGAEVRILFHAFPSFLVFEVSVSRSITACLHSLTPYSTSLTIIPPSINQSIINQSTRYSHYNLLQYRYGSSSVQTTGTSALG
jgi:hypothetical protein